MRSISGRSPEDTADWIWERIGWVEVVVVVVRKNRQAAVQCVGGSDGKDRGTTSTNRLHARETGGRIHRESWIRSRRNIGIAGTYSVGLGD